MVIVNDLLFSCSLFLPTLKYRFMRMLISWYRTHANLQWTVSFTRIISTAKSQETSRNIQQSCLKFTFASRFVLTCIGGLCRKCGWKQREWWKGTTTKGWGKPIMSHNFSNVTCSYYFCNLKKILNCSAPLNNNEGTSLENCVCKPYHWCGSRQEYRLHWCSPGHQHCPSASSYTRLDQER